MLHNRYLPNWLHRLANSAVGGVLSLLAASAAVRVLGAPLGSFWGALLVAFLCAALDPMQFSLVEGCAGEDGYDELTDDNPQKRGIENWCDAFDA
ncbi:MAG: hypothetical protein P4L84_28735 [Isosphaeraceae bacterium]|nr:hypothetical protein [Isosphaeraceae bacterium]